MLCRYVFGVRCRDWVSQQHRLNVDSLILSGYKFKLCNDVHTWPNIVNTFICSTIQHIRCLYALCVCHRWSAYCLEQQDMMHKCSLMILSFDFITLYRISSLPWAPPYSPSSTAVVSSHPATLASIIITILSVPVEWRWQWWKQCQHESDRICGCFDHGMGSRDREGSTLVPDIQRNRHPKQERIIAIEPKHSDPDSFSIARVPQAHRHHRTMLERHLNHRLRENEPVLDRPRFNKWAVTCKSPLRYSNAIKTGFELGLSFLNSSLTSTLQQKTMIWDWNWISNLFRTSRVQVPSSKSIFRRSDQEQQKTCTLHCMRSLSEKTLLPSFDLVWHFGH